MTGSSVSLMVTVNEQAFVLPVASVATQVTVVTPLLKVDPLAGVQTLVAPQLSVTVGLKTTLLFEHWPGSVLPTMGAGQVMRAEEGRVGVEGRAQEFVLALG